jgi:hypothetical protein
VSGNNPPKTVRQDPVADAERAAAQAAVAANSDTASRRRSQRQSALLTSTRPGASSTAPSQSVLTYGKTTLGA